MEMLASVPAPDLRRIAELGNGLLSALNTVREAAPVAWNDSVRGWLVTRHQDVMDGFQGKYPLSCVRMEARSFSPEQLELMSKRYPLTLESIPNWIVNSDGARHARLRGLMTRAFGKKIVEDLRPFARATISAVLDRAAQAGEVEFVEQVARQITGRVILRKFGLPDTLLPNITRWSIAFNTGLGGVVEPTLEVLDEVEACIAEMRGIFSTEIARRRSQPSGDFLSELVQARDGNDQLTEQEVLGICYLVIVAGHDTTLNTMALGTAALCENAGARQYLLTHPEGILNSVMELMRFVAMSTAQNRIALEDFEWHGAKVRKGQMVWLMIAGANRDPRVYANPESIDMSRRTDEVQVFAPGIHHCIGHLLAKMQLTEFFPAFFTRFPGAHLVDAKLEFQPYFTFRGLNRLRVRLAPR
jgi:cytochrome P450